MRSYSPEEPLFTALSGAGLLVDGWLSVQSRVKVHGAPDTFIVNGHQLALVRELIRGGGPEATLARASMSAMAEAARSAPVGTVVEKSRPAPSGSVHDYLSLARYWWPDAESPDGLPYARRDGAVNPECYSEAYDATRLSTFCESVLTLAVSGYLLDRRDLLADARNRIHSWLIAPDTRMNPAFDYAQLVPGRDRPRGAGTIEARRMVYVCDAIRILQSQDALDTSEIETILVWYSDLLGWLRGSAVGQAASSAENNVAIWYHLQLLVFSEFVGDRGLVDEVVDRAGALLAAQIQPDGSMPAEATRENPVDYLGFTFVGMAMLAHVARRSGIDLWDTATAGGRGLSVAHDWLIALGQSEPGLSEWRGGGQSPDDDDADGSATAARHRLALRVAAIRGEMIADRDRTVARLTATVDAQAIEIAGLRPVESGIARPSVPERAMLRRAGAVSPSRFTPDRIRRSLDRRLRGTLAHRAVRKATRERPPAAVPGPSPELLARMTAEYRSAGLDQMPDSYALFRILGNDLPPRHTHGQTLANVRFILENEPELVGCRKRWILNRIVDPVKESELVTLLDAHDQEYTVIPYSAEEYERRPYSLADFPDGDYLESGALDPLAPDQRERALVAAYRHKNNYVMNNNAARNVAIELGQGSAKWVLPFDGSTFFTAAGWSALTETIAARPQYRYVVVPMARIVDNHALLTPGATFPAGEEPQLVLRCDARERFDESRPYGRRPKVDLFWRLGVPGPWERWSLDPWDPPFPEPSADQGQFTSGGWVARLASGVAEAEVAGVTGLRDRGFLRQAAIVDFLRTLDAKATQAHLATRTLAFYDDSSLTAVASGSSPAMRAAVLAEAECALLRGPYAVTDKSSLPPSGNPHDYWHPAPYWWPSTDGDGTPYVWRDGSRRPGTQMFSPSSDRFDRTRLHRMMHDATALALGWAVSADDRHADHGALLVRTWFLDAGTAMAPHLDFAQVRLGHNGNRGQATGLIEMKDLYYFLDAVRLLVRSGALTDADAAGFRTWLRSYFTWFLESPQGQQERRARNNHGTCYDLQALAIATYLGDAMEFDAAVLRATGRLGAQFDDDGSQPEELRRAETRHYCAFNLQSWLNVARIAACGGADLWAVESGGSRVLDRGITWYLSLTGQDSWPYSQVQEFDARRDVPLQAVAASWRDAGLTANDVLQRRAAETLVLHPHDGVAPFWPLACGPTDRQRPDATSGVSP